MKVVALGGGHGLHASLSALRLLTSDVTAVVTVADDGGSSGRIRRELGLLPPGDLRMALSALAGVLVVVCWSMAEKEDFVHLLHDWRTGSVLMATFGFTLVVDLTFGIIAGCVLAAAFAVRTMRVAFDQISPRQEQVALTLGCSRSQAFWRVVLPQARQGVLTAGTVAWARAMGEFGPVLVFSGTTRGYTEVLPTTVFLELSTYSLEGAVAVSVLMVFVAVVVLLIVRVNLGHASNVPN